MYFVLIGLNLGYIQKMQISKKQKYVFFSCLKDHSTKKLGSWAKKCVLQPANGRTDRQTHTKA